MELKRIKFESNTYDELMNEIEEMGLVDYADLPEGVCTGDSRDFEVLLDGDLDENSDYVKTAYITITEKSVDLADADSYFFECTMYVR